MANLTLFATFPIFSHQSDSFSPNFKFFVLGGVHWQIFPDLQLFESFPTEAAQNDQQWLILPLKWLIFAQNGQIWSIFNFSHKKWLRLNQDSQFKKNFLTKAAHFSPNFKIFIWQGGSTSANFPRFATF